MDPRENANLVAEALRGDPLALRSLIDRLLPVVQHRVARALHRAGAASRQNRDLRQEVEDFTQEVLAALFEDHARRLRSWDPARGLSLENYVGLVTERGVASRLRRGRKNPFFEEPSPEEALEEAAGAAERGLSRMC